MPRTGRGGARSGKPGRSYPNRSDLNAQPVRTGPSRAYGDATARADAQRAMPLPQQGAPAPPMPLGAPSQMPGEPVTAGMALGPGPGPSGVTDEMDPRAILRALYVRYPNEGIRRYLMEMGEQ